MELIKHLDIVAHKIDRLSLSDMTRNELRYLTNYLRAQALCDSDRRESQADIQDASIRFVRALYQASLQASISQPQSFWESLERFAGKSLEIKIRARTSAPVGSETWDAKELFNHLLGECEKAKAASDRDACVDALKRLTAEAQKIRSQRNHRQNKLLWKTHVYPFALKFGLMTAFRNNAVLKGRLEFFLKGSF